MYGHNFRIETNASALDESGQDWEHGTVAELYHEDGQQQRAKRKRPKCCCALHWLAAGATRAEAASSHPRLACSWNL